ncbi:MAG: Hsp70 family protein, partial [Candidatus Omnitrophica bacterium]|nr:Hsp70 family protein [Candidatus Omnitrophota bacterium]
KKLSKEEIEKMVKEAEKYASEDSKKKEEVELVNQADSLVYSTEKSLKDYGDKVSQEEKAGIEADLNELKQSIKDKSIEKIKKGMEALTKSAHKLAEEVYKQASAKSQQPAGEQAAGGAGTEGPREEPDKGKEEVIDAEYKDEDKK